MKKSALFGLLIGCLFIVGCNNQNGGSNYSGELTVAGVGPEISFEPTVEEGTLVLRGYFEDHSDHIFLPAGTWEDKFNDESEYLPGNTVKFEGYLTPLDAAAGNHYYEVENIDKLEVKAYPTQEVVKDLFDSYNYCESDGDCTYFMGECPLGCYIPLNVKYMDIASNIMTNFVNHLDERCVYGCVALNKVKCENYKCEMYYEEVDESTNCTPEQKNADMCTMQYDPVCGNDGYTYGNDCVACQSETVESYTMGECN